MRAALTVGIFHRNEVEIGSVKRHIEDISLTEVTHRLPLLADAYGLVDKAT